VSATLGDLIEFDPVRRRWTLLIANDLASPTNRESLSMAATRDRIFIFGGTQGAEHMHCRC
jgi:hypothetical protein